LILLGTFIFVQLKIQEPVFNPRFFSRPAYLAAGVTTAMGNFTMYALLFQLPIFFSDIRSISELEIAGALTAMTLCMMIGGPLAGFAGKTIGARNTAILAALVNMLGLYLMSDLEAVLAPSDIIVSMAMMGFAGGMAGPIVQSAGMLAIDKNSAGMAAGGLSTMRYFGGTIGISILSLQLSTSTATTLNQHLSVIPFYGGAMVLVLLAAFLLPGSKNNKQRSNV
jgi:predicted MFS family arabinose efflux permease